VEGVLRRVLDEVGLVQLGIAAAEGGDRRLGSVQRSVHRHCGPQRINSLINK
jgi:hypothetical protein